MLEQFGFLIFAQEELLLLKTFHFKKKVKQLIIWFPVNVWTSMGPMRYARHAKVRYAEWTAAAAPAGY